MADGTKDDSLGEAEVFFHQRIPLTRAMGLRVVADPNHGFAIAAPVALNYNHLQTAFGGSINAVATLAGYAFLWLKLQGEAAHVVVGASSIRFLQPVTENIRAVCLRPDASELEAFDNRFRDEGKARITLQVRVEENGILAAEFEGLFVARKDQAEAES